MEFLHRLNNIANTFGGDVQSYEPLKIRLLVAKGPSFDLLEKLTEKICESYGTEKNKVFITTGHSDHLVIDIVVTDPAKIIGMEESNTSLINRMFEAIDEEMYKAIDEEKNTTEKTTQLLSEVKSEYSDWSEAFQYSDFPYSSVKEVLHMHEGENDYSPWVLVCRLNNGKFGYLSAWCDYTGWDCQAGGESEIRKTYEEIMELVPENEKELLGVL